MCRGKGAIHSVGGGGGGGGGQCILYGKWVNFIDAYLRDGHSNLR